MSHQYAQGGGYGHPGTYATGNHPPPHQHFQEQSVSYGNCHQNMRQSIFSINAAQALQCNSEDDLKRVFQSKMSHTLNGIQSQELMCILNETPAIRNYYKITWSLELCKIMIAMLDRDKNGIMGYPEFMELLQCLVYWYQTFQQCDCDRSGYIEAHELGQCISHKYKYALSEKALEALLRRYSRAMDDGRTLIAFDDFVSLSIRLRAYTEAFRARDRQQHQNHETGNTTFGYDDFLQCVMCL